ERHVDPDHPRLDRARDAMAARGVARPDGREEAVADVIRDPDRVLLVLERDSRDDRAEDLLLGDGHRAVDSGEHGREIEGARAVPRLPACDDLRSLLTALLDEAVHAVAMRGGDEGADLRLGVERIPDVESLRRLCEARDEVVVDGRLDEHARARLAA